MAELAIQDARALFTKRLIALYQERIYPSSFLRSFFKVVTSPTKEVAIEAERGFEKVAIDVLRGTEGNRNMFSVATEKVFIPPFFREYFDATFLDMYDRVLGSQGSDNSDLFAALLNSVADRLGLLRNKIERAIELQCAQVLETGVVTLSQGIAASIDFKRKALSLVDLGGGNYLANNIDPFVMFETGCIFLRQVGKAAGGTFNAIMGSQALSDLLVNTKFTTRQNLINMALDQVHGPQRNALGNTFHGTVTAGAFKVQLWAYPQFYDDPNSGVSTAYVNTKKIFLIPENPNFDLAFAAVPQLVGQPGQMPVQGDFVMGEYLDERLASHIFDVKAAPIAIPVAVDQIYTIKACA